MNNAMLAVIIVSLGALLPVPTAQGVGKICTEDVEEAVLDLVDENLKNVMYEAGACVVSCDGLIGLETPDKTYCVDGPTVQTCEKPYVGVVVEESALDLCLEAELPSRGTCPPGTVGAVVDGRSVCIEDSVDVDPCAEVDCDIVPELGRHHPCDADGYSEDDSGFGGTHATCYYACMAAELLYIEVRAEDADADVAGYTNCGGAHADCDRKPVTCHGVSEGFTDRADDDQGCVGDSYEIHSSRITVTCYAIGQSLACQLVGVRCPGVAASSKFDLCTSDNPLVPVDIVERLLDGIPSEASSFVSYEFERSNDGTLTGFVVNYDANFGEPSCSGGLLR